MQPANGTLEGSLANIANDPTGAPEPVAMSLAQQIVIWVIYAVMLLFFAFKPTVLGLGRPLVALLAAAVVVFVQDLTPGPSQNLTEDVDYDILMYLFGLMVISHYMNMTGITRVPNSVFKWTLKHYGPYGLIWALSFFTGLVAMFFTNDMAVFLLTPMVVRLTNAPKYAQQLKGSSFIFLMLISTNANIASAMSPIGNPQNVLVASISGVSFGTFFAYLSIATIICWTLNTATLCLWFWTLQRKHAQSLLKGGATESLLGSENKNAINSGYLEEDDDEEEQQHNGNGTSNASVDPLYVDGQREKPQVRLTAERHFTALPSSVLNIMTVASTLIFVAWILLVSMVEKITLGWATVLAALLVVLVHSVALAVTGHTRSADPEAEIFRNPEVVDYGLIFMFWANFVLIGALLDTGWPQYVFDALLGSVGDAMVELVRRP